MPGPLSSMTISSGSEMRWLTPCTADADAGPERGREPDLGLLRPLKRLGGVLHEIEEDLDELVAVAVDRRQRRIVLLGEGDAARDAVLGQQLHPVEDDVDVDRLALHRPVVAEHLDAVDEIDDAVGLLADQAGQRQLLGGDASARAAAPRRGCPTAGS